MPPSRAGPVQRLMSLSSKILSLLTGSQYARVLPPVENGFEGHTLNRKRKILVILFCITLTLLVSFCTISMRRHGLFNNTRDETQALSEHNVEWEKRVIGRSISRLKLLQIMRRFDGICITEESNWETVPLDQSLERFVNERKAISCMVDVRSRWPMDFPRSYRWVVILMPSSRDILYVVSTRRFTSI